MSSEEFQKACRLGDIDCIKTLLQKSPSLLHSQDQKLGWSSLYRTIVCEHFEVSKFLLEQGADPNARNFLGEAPLHQAAENNNLELLNLLLSYKADPNLKQTDGETALHISVLKEHTLIVESLLRQGANPNLSNTTFGKTPLHYAIQKENSAIIEMLFNARANPNILDKGGRKAADYLMTNSNKEDSRLSEEKKSFEIEIEKLKNKEEFSRNESVFEPECEKPSETTLIVNEYSFGVEFEGNKLYTWLVERNLGCLFEKLYSNGFDDLEMLIEEIEIEPLTDDVLQTIGIEKPGHRARLLFLLENWRANPIENEKSFFCWKSYSERSGMILRTGMEEWLKSLNLEYLFGRFIEAGYDDLEELFELMHSKYALTDDLLAEELEIKKLGHRERIMVALRNQELMKIEIESDMNSTSCKCILM